MLSISVAGLAALVVSLLLFIIGVSLIRHGRRLRRANAPAAKQAFVAALQRMTLAERLALYQRLKRKRE